jgi:hypothetical protein
MNRLDRKRGRDGVGYKYSHEEGGRDMYLWTCDNCGRSLIVPEGADVAFCQCEYEEEGCDSDGQ